MKKDRIPIVAERSVSASGDSTISAGLPVFLRVMKLPLDQTPTKPTRRSWNSQVDGSSEMEIDFQIHSPLEEDKSGDHSTVVSDVTDPSVFWGSLNEDDFNVSLSNLDALRSDGLDISLRVEALGPLDEESFLCDSFEILREEGTPSSSSQDRAVFDTNSKDCPPQVAERLYSSADWTIDSEPMDDRFQDVAPGHQDKPMTLPKPSYSQQQSLAKLAETFKAGCAVGTHTYHLKKYPNTFVGSEAVDFMLSVNLASTREDAVFLGQQFCKELNLFYHVCWDHTFKDGLFFYRFNNESAKKTQCAAPISRKELVTLSEKFVENMPVSRHMSVRFRSYSNTFSGEEAVDFMLRAKLASDRSTAVFLGQRMMEELDIFECVDRKRRFKDSCYLYRFVDQDDTDCSYEEHESIMSLMESVGAEHHRYTPISPLPSTEATGSSALSSSPVKGRKNHRVSFGLVQSRSFERCPDCNPATTSGPSLGLGWRFYDNAPVPLRAGNAEEMSFRGGRLSLQERTDILKEWGYSKVDIKKATRCIKIVREQRKRSLNRDRRCH